jgi:hypothetical protein
VKILDDLESSLNLLLDGSNLKNTRGSTVNIMRFTFADFVVESQSSSALSLNPSSEMKLERSTTITHSQLGNETRSCATNLAIDVDNLHERHSQTWDIQRITSARFAMQSLSSLARKGQPFLPLSSHLITLDSVSPLGGVNPLDHRERLWTTCTRWFVNKVHLALDVVSSDSSVNLQDLLQSQRDTRVVFIATTCNTGLQDGSSSSPALQLSSHLLARHVARSARDGRFGNFVDR